jgi:hypothetical protein
VDGAAPCNAIDGPLPPRVLASTSADEALLSAMTAHPGASASALADILHVGKGSVAGRWGRLGQRGVLVKCADGRWRLATQKRPIVEDEEDAWGETIERLPLPAFDPRLWVKPINDFVRVETGPFDCRRYG